ncbi:MAG: aspartate-semialdehyde dehydrogenase [Planctomycetia bacterium]
MAVHLAVVGATGVVGQEMLRVLEEHKFPYKSIRFLASGRSAGGNTLFDGRPHPVAEVSAESLKGVDIVLSSTPKSVSKEFSPLAAAAGAVVVDNSSAYRMDPTVPLVVPEVNPHVILTHRGIIANPNCGTIQMVVALKPLHDLAGIKRLVVSTYQASSGKGAKALAEFESQLAAVGRGEQPAAAAVHRHRLVGNCLPDDWTFDDDSGNNEEEIKIVNETRKIMGVADLPVVVTCVRVPVHTGHSESLNVEFHRPISVAEARAALAKAPGVVLIDDPKAGKVPLAADCVGRDETFVGRIRKDSTVPHGLNLWVVADNLRKGAATNAVQIAEHLLKLRPS